MSGRVGAVLLEEYEAAVRRDERERILGCLEDELAKWEAWAPTFPKAKRENALLCKRQVEHVIARIRRGGTVHFRLSLDGKKRR